MSQPYPRQWPDLGLWNFYFLAKFVLLWMGLLNFQALLNLLFAAGLLVPLPGRALPILRQIVAVPLGVALFYKDTWYPPFRRLFEQTEVLAFTPAYVVELLERFINWDVVGVLCALLLAYLFIAPWLRLSLVNTALLLWVFLAGALPTLAPQPAQPVMAAGAPLDGQPAVTGGVADTATIDAWLAGFYREQASLMTSFPASNPAVEPFDLLVLNICSLAWDDLEEVGLRDNPLLRGMDVIFDNFNSATSYSGPAAIRVLRASCGQSSHDALYQRPATECLLFDNLALLGFSPQVVFNHNGSVTENYKTTLAEQDLPPPLLNSEAFHPVMQAYDGAFIARDLDMLQAWWGRRLEGGEAAVSLFYNSITLHDGNRMTNPDGNTRRATYQERAETFIDDIDSFVDLLEQSGRRVVLMLVPEHGAGVHGDLMQIAGMREIPSRSITHVPVGIKLINMGETLGDLPQRVTAPSSYLALSELVARLYAAQPGAVDWPTLLAGLPESPAISENSDAMVVEYAGLPYVRLSGQSQWIPYPQQGR